LIRRRQIRALEDALDEVRRFSELVTDRHPAEIASIHLRDATSALETLIGTTDIEDILETIFRNFCVGK